MFFVEVGADFLDGFDAVVFVGAAVGGAWVAGWRGGEVEESAVAEWLEEVEVEGGQGACEDGEVDGGEEEGEGQGEGVVVHNFGRKGVWKDGILRSERKLGLLR